MQQISTLCGLITGTIAKLAGIRSFGLLIYLAAAETDVYIAKEWECVEVT
ncbi:hypothetical protein AB4Z22_35220 [Paenibacillus sp. TAF58]